jgi:hypothetical protein
MPIFFAFAAMKKYIIEIYEDNAVVVLEKNQE